MEKELNVLLSRNIEAYSAYTLASNLVDNANFKSFLTAYSSRRKEFASEIKAALAKRGFEVNGGSSLLSSAQRGWMRLRLALPGSKDKAVLRECARAEGRALKDYEQVINTNELPNDIQELLMKQRDKILVTERSLKDIAPLLKHQNVAQQLKDNSKE